MFRYGFFMLRVSYSSKTNRVKAGGSRSSGVILLSFTRAIVASSSVEPHWFSDPTFYLSADPGPAWSHFAVT